MEKQKITSFTKLVAWQESHKLVLKVYKIVENFPKKEIFILTSQLLRAVISVSSNIAEGFSRISQKEKIQFYSISLGSLTEVQNHLLIAKDLGYINVSQFNSLADQAILIHKLINGLIKSVGKRIINP
ncbi:four helix bundle protein [Candidatus Beckwithbacteria bacterium CG23_combo_of_CG06-09_8_20_14_all_34_8]|uniref:Four helix bundle protein n=1 Tax=Candidatus Beckwithbacteria bacterium CG23_combo_of_CG06-09_8_20_14_all_34_8 TaxID=1974497 RepID=A0A2H0B5L8_9BACT|nr:MAG: four helix bundle protein [Candidatus Beckwithbacteria bacterium CG23_combo_of_CG06-09_8_20_14_all_34_8]